MKALGVVLVLVGVVVAALAAPDMSRAADVGAGWAMLSVALGLAFILAGAGILLVVWRKR